MNFIKMLNDNLFSKINCEPCDMVIFDQSHLHFDDDNPKDRNQFELNLVVCFDCIQFSCHQIIASILISIARLHGLKHHESQLQIVFHSSTRHWFVVVPSTRWNKLTHRNDVMLEVY